ncbi:MAG: ubiquitin-conjugating enzyme E2 [Ardenticatenaceae bacterium]|nr:ubiquitin-conjugating enzyme E2 [Ardenticatenaceae bacterium]
MSFNIRETRLRNDYQKIKDLAQRSDLIQVVKTDGHPPDRYLIRYLCRGVEAVTSSGTPQLREMHEVSIYLHAEYPLKQPQLKWKTPIFHPNIHTTGAVCIGAWWPAKTLDELVLTMGDMVQYKNYEPKDPMNSKAAAWAMRNRQRFPIDDRELKGASQLLDSIVIGAPEAGQEDDLGINFL